MNRVWLPPPQDFVKVNIFVVTLGVPLANGNENGVGIIMWYQNGFLIWGVMGLVPNTIFFKFSFGLYIEAWKKLIQEANIFIETEHFDSFHILRRQNFVKASREGLVAPIQAINACNPLLPLDYGPVCRIYTISAPRNQVVRLAANFGMMHLSELNRVIFDFIPIRNLLDTDIGWGLHLPALEEVENYGLGEVV